VAYLIGIAGPSGSGKSTLAQNLEQALPGTVAQLALDSYYRDLSHLEPDQRAQVNFDAPDSLEHGLLRDHLTAIAQGHAIEVPVYSFAAHLRQTETQRLHPSDYLIIEGIFTLYWPEVRSLFDLSVFIAVDDALSLERRTLRDVAQRGRTAADVKQQYEQTVRPMYQQHIAPTQEHADLVLPGDQAIEHSVTKVLHRVPRQT
jgi:uridine kinase